MKQLKSMLFAISISALFLTACTNSLTGEVQPETAAFTIDDSDKWPIDAEQTHEPAPAEGTMNKNKKWLRRP